VLTSMNVSEGGFVNIGQQIATVATIEKLRLKFDVNAEDVKYFSIGSEVVITSNVSEDLFKGEVITIASSADPQTRSFQIEAMVDNSDHLLKPGMFVRIDYIVEELENVIMIPRTAILILDNQPTIFLVKNNIAAKKEITTGTEVNGNIVIISGVEVGDTLVTLGQDYLEDGLKVNITTWEENY